MTPMPAFSSLLPLTLSLLLFHHHHHLLAATADAPTDAPATTAGSPLIEKACNGSQYKDLCISTLNSDQGSKTTDLKGLAFISLKNAVKNASDTAVKIKKLLSGKGPGPSVDDGLLSCEKEYNDIVDQIDDSINALVSGAFDDVNNWLEAALADIETCDENLGDKVVDITHRNEILRQLCSNCLSIVNVLSHKG
ncbi:Pectinesterase [Bertholletia excelsa]